MYDVTAWLTNTYNTHIVQYLTKERQPDNEIWSDNIFFKNHAENKAERLVPDLSVF